MADLSAIPQIAPFVPDSDPTSVAQRWKRWSDRFDNLVVAMNVTNNNRKKALLLHLAGEAVFDIFEGLVLPDIADDADPAVTNAYTVAKGALDNHFNPKKNVEFERYTFRSSKQQSGEGIDAYHARLRSLSKYCEFPNVDAEIKSHVIQTCKSSRLRRRALTDAALTLQQLIDLGRSMEMSERHTKLIEGGPSDAVVDNTSVAQVNRMRERGSGNWRATTRAPSASAVCRNCGKSYPHPGGKTSCPAWGTQCRGCLKDHHWIKCCRSRGKSGQNQGQFTPATTRTSTTYM